MRPSYSRKILKVIDDCSRRLALCSLSVRLYAKVLLGLAVSCFLLNGCSTVGSNNKEVPPTSLDFRLVNPNYSALAYADNRWVAVGEIGAVVYSSDGETWHSVAKNPTTSDLSSVAYANNRWVAVGGVGAVVYSGDGETWHSVSKNPTTSDLSSVTYANNRWVAVGSRGAVVYSADGETWHSVSKSPTMSNLGSVANANNRWVAVGASGNILTTAAGARRVSWLTGLVVRWKGDKPVAAISLSSPPSSHSVLSVQLVGDLEAVYNITHSLQPIGEPKHIAGGRNQTVEIPIDPKQLQDIPSRFLLSAELTDEGWTDYYPRSGPGKESEKPGLLPSLPVWALPASIAAALIFFWCLVVLVVFWRKPIGILWIQRLPDSLGPLGDIKIPWTEIKLTQLAHLSSLWLVPSLATRPRVLQARIDSRSVDWSKRWAQEPLVRACDGYDSLPCVNFANGKQTPFRPDIEWFLKNVDSSIDVLEIVGTGGAGKSMLAIEICRWLLTGLTGDVRLPVLVDEEIPVEDPSNSVLKFVADEINKGLDKDRADESLVRSLLKGGQIVLVFDRLSERADSTFAAVEALSRILKVRAVIVSTRRSADYSAWNPLRLCPVPLDASTVLGFLERLSALVAKSQVLDVDGNGAFLTRLAKAINLHDEERPLSPLFVRLFFDEAIAAKASGASIEDLSKTIPDCYYNFVRRTNPKVDRANKFADDELLEAARVIAAESLGDSFIPRNLHIRTARQCFSSKDWGDRSPLDALIDNGILRHTVKGVQDSVSFTYDPIAEYLAADYHLIRLHGKSAELEAFVSDVRAKGKEVEGFFLALEYVAQAHGIPLPKPAM